jgi:hypothetical protein
VLLPSDAHRKLITSVTAVLLPFTDCPVIPWGRDWGEPQRTSVSITVGTKHLLRSSPWRRYASLLIQFASRIMMFREIVARWGVRFLRRWWSDFRRVLIEDRFNWALWYSAWLHFTVHCYTHTHTHTLVSTPTSSLPLPGSGFQRRTVPMPQVPDSHNNRTSATL